MIKRVTIGVGVIMAIYAIYNKDRIKRKYEYSTIFNDNFLNRDDIIIGEYIPTDEEIEMLCREYAIRTGGRNLYEDLVERGGVL